MQMIRSSVAMRYHSWWVWIGWVAGLAFGFIVALVFREYLIAVTPSIIVGRTSAFDLVICGILPYLVLLYASEHAEPWLLPILCAVKAFIFGFCSFGIAFTYGSAGWLVRFFALFCDICTMPLLLWLCLRYGRLRPGKPSAVWAYPLYTLCVITVYCLQIAPFFDSILA